MIISCEAQLSGSSLNEGIDTVYTQKAVFILTTKTVDLNKD